MNKNIRKIWILNNLLFSVIINFCYNVKLYLGDANGRFPDPSDAIVRSDEVAPDPALGVIINFRKSVLIKLRIVLFNI